MMHTLSQQKGFTLLLATLVSSLLMALGLSIWAIAQKEIILSTLARDSQFAFYAADTGAECALNWDFNGAFDSQTTPFTSATCDGQSIGSVGGVPYGTASAFQFENNGLCVRVQVTKNATTPFTQIESRGYSSSCSVIDAGSNRRALERAVRMQY